MTRRGRRLGGILAAFGGAALLPFGLVGHPPGGTAQAPPAIAIPMTHPSMTHPSMTHPDPSGPPPPAVAALFSRDGFAGAFDLDRVAHRRRGLSILQIGDSHTAADLFTDVVRQRLQARHGVGAPGRLPVGSPHAGIRSAVAKVSASPGWSYESLQRSATPETFGLSGYNAVTRLEGETLTVSAEAPVPYAVVEIEAWAGPEAGSLAVEIDGGPARALTPDSGGPGAILYRIRPPGGANGTFRRLVVRTTSAKPVTISGLAVRRPDAGLTYSAVGYPGATIDILGKLPARTVTEALARQAPDLIVLAFGTNEGFNDTLDLDAYRARYAAMLRLLRSAAPRARLVMIGPPQAERVAAPCKPAPGTVCAPPAAMPEGEARADGPEGCARRPPRLAAVRAVQRDLARAEGIPFWDWWALMPSGCGAERWVGADPPLMARDHVHFTRAGYRVSGRSFADVLESQIRSMLRGDHAVSYH